MGANGCVQQLDLADIFTMSISKVKNDVKMVNLFTQARSTCLPWPSQPVYQAWSTCVPRPGLPVYLGLLHLFTRPGQKGYATSEITIFKMLAAGP